MDGLQWLGNIAQTGGVGIALVALWILYKVLTNHTAHTNDVISKNADALVESAKANMSLSKSVESLERTIENKIK